MLFRSAYGFVDSVLRCLAQNADAYKFDWIIAVKRSAFVAHRAKIAGVSGKCGERLERASVLHFIYQKYRMERLPSQ